MAEDEEAAEGEEGGAGKKSKKMLFIILAVVLLLGAGIPAALLMGGGEEAGEHGEGEHHEEVVHYETYELDTFIVNLTKTNSFLKVRLLVEFNPNLVFGDDHHGEGGGAAYGGGGAGGGAEVPTGPPGVLGERDPMIRDAIIRVLSAKTAEQVLSLDGKDELKEEIIDAINDATGLDEGPVVNVYFLEFIVQ